MRRCECSTRDTGEWIAGIDGLNGRRALSICSQRPFFAGVDTVEGTGKRWRFSADRTPEEGAHRFHRAVLAVSGVK